MKNRSRGRIIPASLVHAKRPTAFCFIPGGIEMPIRRGHPARRRGHAPVTRV